MFQCYMSPVLKSRICVPLLQHLFKSFLIILAYKWDVMNSWYILWVNFCYALFSVEVLPTFFFFRYRDFPYTFSSWSPPPLPSATISCASMVHLFQAVVLHWNIINPWSPEFTLDFPLGKVYSLPWTSSAFAHGTFYCFCQIYNDMYSCLWQHADWFHSLSWKSILCLFTTPPLSLETIDLLSP